MFQTNKEIYYGILVSMHARSFNQIILMQIQINTSNDFNTTMHLFYIFFPMQ